MNSFGMPFADVTDLFSNSDLEGFPIDRPYTKTRLPLTSNSQRREIGHLAVWTLSSARPEQGVEQLRDDSNSTYWQSDGAQPHTLTIYFPRKTAVSELCLYLDFKSDESYTPSKLTISLGNTGHDMWEVQSCDLDEPVGWYNFALGKLHGGLFQSVSTHYVQLCILQNQHNGRDTHLRQVKIFGHREELNIAFPTFTTNQYSQYTLLR